MTPDKNFRMAPSSKALLALLPGNTDAHARGHFKRSLIQAQLAEEAARRASLKSKEGRDNKSGPRGNNNGAAYTAPAAD